MGARLRQPQGLPFQLKVQPHRRETWWDRLRSLADSPVVHLVSLQRRRRARYGAAEMARMAALFGLPMLFMCLVEDRSALTAFLLFSALGLMVGLPLRQFGEEVALLASLQRGRCLDEIVSTGTSPQGVLDGLALQGLMQIGKAALTVWPVLLLGTLGLPPQWQLPARELELLWLPGLAALFLAGYYLAQFLQVFPGSGLKRLVITLALLCPLALLYFGLAGAFAAALIMSLTARQLAILGLRNPERPRAVPVHKRNPLVRSFSQNPVTRRELSRLAGQMGGNWVRLAIWRASMTILPVAWTLHAVSAPTVKWPDVLAGGILMFGGLFFVRSAQRTLPAVVREREQKSWEILMQTRIATRTFVSGWLQVCLYTVFSEGLLALLAVGGYALAMVPSDQWPGAGLSLLAMPVACLLGACVGLAISASSRDTRQASQSLVRWCLLALCGWLVTLGLYGGSRLFEPGVLSKLSPDDSSYSPVLGLTSLLTLLPVGLALLVLAARHLRLLSCIDPEESPHFEQGSRYSPVVCSLDLASLAGLYCGLKAWKQFSGLFELTALHGASLLIAGVLIWWLLVRMPLATLAEAALGGRISLPIGMFYGFGLGELLGLLQQNWIDPAMVPPTMVLGSVAVGAIQGLMAAGTRPIRDERVQILIRRVRWSGLSALAALGLAATLYFNQVPPAHSVPPTNDWTPYWRQKGILQRLSDKLKGGDINRKALKEGLPDFGTAQNPGPSPAFYLPRQDWGRLQVIAAAQRKRGQGEVALNTLRWWLLCCDSCPIRQSELSLFRDEDFPVYQELEGLLNQIRLKPSSGRDLIEQLLDESSLQNELRTVYANELEPFLRYLQELRELPDFYLEREQAALALARERAERKIQQLQLWELSEGEGLLADIHFCPLARRQVDNLQLRAHIRESLRLATRREGLALVVAIQLYRQEHGGSWPADLDQIQKRLPRPARCYLNAGGNFYYKPGSLVGPGENPNLSLIFQLRAGQPD